MAEIKREKINISGCDVNVLEAGAQTGRPVILLHGMKFQADTWKELGTIDFLAGAGCLVIAVDLPGFGKSPAGPVQPSEVLETVIESHGLEKPVLLGPSMGGRVSLEFCLDHPELLGGLVLVGPVGIPENLERIGNIKVPVLAIWGELDSISPPANGKLFQEKVPECRLVVIAGAPHPCYLENKGVFHREVEQFIHEL